VLVLVFELAYPSQPQFLYYRCPLTRYDSVRCIRASVLTWVLLIVHLGEMGTNYVCQAYFI
jgi:hypothetical protein